MVTFVINSKYPTFVNLILMAKFNPMITAYLIPYATEEHDNKNGESILARVEHIIDVYHGHSCFAYIHTCQWYSYKFSPK